MAFYVRAFLAADLYNYTAITGVAEIKAAE